MKKIDEFLYGVLIVLAVLTFASFFAIKARTNGDFSFDSLTYLNWSDEWKIRDEKWNEQVLTLPVKINIPPGEVLTCSKVLPQRIKKYNCIMITGKRQDITVLVGGILRTTYTDKDLRTVGNSSPDAQVLVPIYSTDAGKEVVIKISSDTDRSGDLQEIFLGSEQSIILNLIKNNTATIFVSFMVMILGIICLLGDIVIRIVNKKTTILGFLFWFSELAGIWSLTHNKLRQVFVGKISVFSNLGYCCVMLLAIPIFFIMNMKTKGRYAIAFRIMTVICCINFFAQNILQMTTSYDFYSMTNISSYILLGSIIIVFVITAIDVARGYIKQIFATTLSFICIAVCGVIEIVNSFNRNADNQGSVIIIGTFLFIAVNGLSTVFDILREERLRQNAINASKAKSQFLATMSHEIRTPINAVLGMNEMILRDSREDTIKEYAGNIAEAGKSLLSLVNDILDFSKIESGKMDIVNVEYQLKNILRDLVLMIEGRISEKGLDLVTDIDESIPSIYFGDEVRIKQVVTNLLTNAAKYTESGSICFTVKLDKIENDIAHMYFSVKDTGIGIKPEDLDKLASSFIRVDEARNRNIEGTGLGLSITKQLLELMGSELQIESTYGEGSNFYFRLQQKIISTEPLGNINEGKIEAAKAKSIEFTAPEVRILAVDDNPMNLTVVKGLLRPTKIQIDVAESGKAALKMCENTYYDIIFMDHMMPEMDGIETLKVLRTMEMSLSCHTKVIALTANAISGAQEMYINEGFDGYLTKPIDVGELCNTIINLVPRELILSGEAVDTAETAAPFTAAADNLQTSAAKTPALNTVNVDGELAMNYCGNDFDSYIEILKSYYKFGRNTLAPVINNKERLFDVDTIADFTIKAHSLKSSSLTIGAKELSELAKALEAAGKEADDAFISENVPKCRKLYDTVLDEIGAYLIVKGYIEPEFEDPDDEYSTDAADEGAALGSSGELAAETRKKLVKAKNALDDFDYDIAMEIIDEILGA